MSGLSAASESMSARADNIVNARSSARGAPPAEDVFRPYRVTNQSVRGGGVETEIRPVDPSHEVVYDPDDPNANADGEVALPNVNLEEEVVGMRQDRAAWMANLAVIRTADEMAGALLDAEA